MIAVDTNVLVYAVDANEHEKGPRALALLDELSRQPAVLLWQVACEFGAAISRKQAKSEIRIEIAEVLRAWMDIFPLVLPTPGVLVGGWRLQSLHQLSYWDSLLLAACADAGVTRLYTEDLQSKPVIEGIELVNPFRA